MFIFKKKSQLNFSWFKNLRQSLLSIHWYVSKIDRKRSSTLHTFGLHLAPRDRRHLRRYGISSTALCSQALLSDFLRPVYLVSTAKKPISWDFDPRCQYPRASKIRWYSSRLEALDYESSGFFRRSLMLIIMVHPKKNKKHDHHFLWNHFFGHLMLLSKTQLFDNSFNSRFQKYHMCCCNSRWQRFHLQHHTWHRFITSVEVGGKSSRGVVGCFSARPRHWPRCSSSAIGRRTGLEVTKCSLDDMEEKNEYHNNTMWISIKTFMILRNSWFQFCKFSSFRL